MERAFFFALSLATLLASASAAAVDHQVTLSAGSFTPSDLTVAVGDTVTFRNQSGFPHNAVTDPGAANPFRCANGCDATGGNGAPSAANWVATVTITNAGVTPYYCAVHGGPGGIGMSGTITATGSATAAPAARDDFHRFRIGDDPQVLDVLANDLVDPAALAGGSLAIVQAPGAGSATVVDGGNAGTAADDTIRYTVPADGPAATTLRYRVCDGSARCDDGDVRVLVRALPPLFLEQAADASFHDIPIDGLPAMPEARFEASTLVGGAYGQAHMAADPTPATPWDASRAGTDVVVHTVPAGQDGATSWTVLVTAASAADVDLFVGLDADGDLEPDENELRCTSAMSTSDEDCEFAFENAGPGDATYWAMTQNLSGDTAVADVFFAHVPNLPGPAGDGTLAATGPGHLAAGEAATMRLGVDDPTLLSGGSRVGTVLVRPQPGADFGRSPVRITRSGGDAVGRALVSGVDTTVRVDSPGSHERLYVDVPPGATSLTVTTASDADFDLYLAPRATTTFPAIEAAPPRNEAVASATSPSGDESITLTPPQLTAGRWYVTPVNQSAEGWDVTVRATVAAAAPVVRSGSYFNPDRSGHGLFLYPAGAGAVWTVIWYHFLEDGSPTWYYLEAAAPGANGVWSSGVYRSAWDGDSNFLTRVGTATLTPTGPDAFAWSWTVDGRSGAEPLAALGRGCPTVGGIVRDTSSTWFDPATAGTGYSVQVFPNGYEFTAAFVYDGQGRPRYLAAERPPPAPGDVATYALEQLTGFCPLCPRAGAPTRQDIGVFTRTFAGGRMSRMELDAVYAGGVPGAWTGDDTIQPLGGDETVQGCDP